MIKSNFEVMKSDDEHRQVFGWASIAVTTEGETLIDLQKDIIEPEVLEQAAYEFCAFYGTAGEMHQKANVGTLIESVVFTEEKAKSMGIPQGILPQGWWVGFHIHDLEVWKKVKDGTYPMFSIEGTCQWEHVDEPPDKQGILAQLSQFLRE